MKITCGKTIATLAAATAMSGLSSAAFAAETWLSCNGNVATIPSGAKAPAATEASARVLAVNDQNQKLYQWSDKRKELALVPTLTYAPDKITWGAEMMNSSGMSWQGSLDRAKMKVDISRKDRDGVTMVWKEQCQPTEPLTNGAGAQVASSKEETASVN